MRTLIVPLIAVGVVFTPVTDEPSERQMQFAFEDALSLQVRNALEFAHEAFGPAAVERIRRNGTDRFSVNAFQKLRCEPQAGKAGHVCAFHVGLGLATGPMERTLTGRFLSAPGGLVFVDELDATRGDAAS